MTTRVGLGALLLLASVLCGCHLSRPGARAITEADALRDVASTHNVEFEAALPAMQENRFPPGSFARTLAAIARARSLELAPDVAARLSVRAAMIHLQTGDLGRARAMAREVERAAVTLGAGSGTLDRDAMLAAAWPALLRGEGALAARPAAPAGSAEAQRAGVELAPRLAAAGAQIRSQLCAARRAGRLPDQGRDGGAALLAAQGSVYLSGADAVASMSCALNPAADEIAICAAGEDRRFLREARDLMEAFLPPEPDGRFEDIAERHREDMSKTFSPDAPPPAADPCTR